MEKIFVYDANNNRVQVDVVKYFRHNYTNYFIYTANETDEKGFIKLYVIKVMKALGSFVAYNITEEDDWQTLQQVVKQLIKQIKQGDINEFEQLDYNSITDIKIQDARFFKLDPSLVNILSTDFNSIEIKEINNELLEINIVEDYEALYLNIKKEKEALDVILSKMLREVTEYRIKYGKIELPEDNTQLLDKEIIEPKDEKDYENMYLKVKHEKEALDIILSKMLREVTEYRIKYGKL